MRKITPEIEQRIVELLPKKKYSDIVDNIRDEFGVELTEMAVCGVKERNTKRISLRNAENLSLGEEQDKLIHSINMSLDLLENRLEYLKNKEKEQGSLEHDEVKELNEIVDRLCRLKREINVNVVATKELSFPTKELRKKYGIASKTTGLQNESTTADSDVGQTGV